MAEFHERVILVSLRVGKFTARKKDKGATEEVHLKHGAEVDAGAYTKLLLAKPTMKAVQHAESKARTRHRMLTLPWDDDGNRIISTRGYTDYTDAMRECRMDYDEAVNEFCDHYPDYIEAARTDGRLGTLFDADDYPNEDKIRKKFKFDFELNPLPHGDDIRVDISEDAAKAMAEDIERRTKQRIEDAMNSVFGRILDVTGKMAERLSEYKGKGGEGKRFRDAIVVNVLQVAELLPVLNVTDDPRIDQLQQEMLAITDSDHAPELLRDDDDLRGDTQRRAQAIHDKVSQILA